MRAHASVITSGNDKRVGIRNIRLLTMVQGH